MEIRISSVLATAFFVLAVAILVFNGDDLMNIGPSYSQEQQFKSVLVWAGLCLLIVSAVKLALAETRSRQDRRRTK